VQAASYLWPAIFLIREQQAYLKARAYLFFGPSFSHHGAPERAAPPSAIRHRSIVRSSLWAMAQEQKPARFVLSTEARKRLTGPQTSWDLDWCAACWSLLLLEEDPSRKERVGATYYCALPGLFVCGLKGFALLGGWPFESVWLDQSKSSPRGNGDWEKMIEGFFWEQINVRTVPRPVRRRGRGHWGCWESTKVKDDVCHPHRNGEAKTRQREARNGWEKRWAALAMCAGIWSVRYDESDSSTGPLLCEALIGLHCLVQ